MRHQDRSWYVLPSPMPARRASGGQETTHDTAIAFAFDGDDVIWLSARGGILAQADGWNTSLVRP